MRPSARYPFRSMSPEPTSTPPRAPVTGESPSPRRRRGLLRTLVRPFRPSRTGTMPAGLVLMIVVLALGVAAFLNADATLRKSKAKGDGWRQEVAQMVASVSDAVGLNRAREGVDQAMGRNQDNSVSVDDLLAQKLAETDSAAAQADPQATRVAAPPKLRQPTPDAPLRFWVGGDSVAGTYGTSMQRIANETGVFTPTLDYRVSTGLARPDYFNWPEHFVKDVLPGVQPDVMVLMFGANDSQNMVIDGKPAERFSEPWLTEYRRRVGATMDLLRSENNDRMIIWVGAAPTGPNSGVATLDKENYIYWSEAQKRPWVTYVDTWAILGTPDYTYAGSAPYADGQTRNMYQKDNVHLATTGADRLSWATLSHIGRFVDLSLSKAVAPASQLAPATVKERDTLPVPT